LAIDGNRIVLTFGSCGPPDKLTIDKLELIEGVSGHVAHYH
jgi:hypothetical protein